MTTTFGICLTCHASSGFHSALCPHKPKRGNKACSDPACSGWNGWHSPSCTTKGYQVAAAEPETKRAVPAVQEPEMCCGGTCVRAVCMFHGGKATP